MARPKEESPPPVRKGGRVQIWTPAQVATKIRTYEARFGEGRGVRETYDFPQDEDGVFITHHGDPSFPLCTAWPALLLPWLQRLKLANSSCRCGVAYEQVDYFLTRPKLKACCCIRAGGLFSNSPKVESVLLTLLSTCRLSVPNHSPKILSRGLPRKE
jgi:hypothetical protein